MSQDQEKYMYFTVGLLKSSFALDALSQDALKYHMIDHQDKLIALRLTEYYEMLAQGILRPGTNLPQPATPTAIGHADGREGMSAASSTRINGANPTTDQVGDYQPDDEGVVATSSYVDENADEAAKYWALL